MKNYKIKITGSGTQTELVKALMVIANEIRMAGSARPEGVTDQLDDEEWEDATLCAKIDVEE